jgi:hypothetical protein
MPDCSGVIAGGPSKQEELLLFSGVGITYEIPSNNYPRSADDVVKFMLDAKSMRTNSADHDSYIALLKKMSDTLAKVDKMLENATNGTTPQILTFYRNIIKSSNDVIAANIRIHKEEYAAMKMFIKTVSNMAEKGKRFPNT